ncbi:hypothetical protein H0H81_002882 [Sphagnurus paluster]|uniref:Fungal-type protein kinase domain-containing protein n=1 Tax=Sphagnurus paluster TaxID=117069 RepID=A0A9P7KIC7_9AGAR|nr:hypothetical protein H0H81_002882 [Sphagnurus paluster]
MNRRTWKVDCANISSTARHLVHLDPGCSNNIQYALGTISQQDNLHREARVGRVLVLDSPDSSVTWKSDTSTFMGLWVQWYQCHRALWVNGTKYGSMNLLAKYDQDQGTTIGFLNDFDIAHLKKNRRVDKPRLAAMPFMAFDLLTLEYHRGRVERLYRHDLESFIWVLVFVTLARCTSNLGSAGLVPWKYQDYNYDQVRQGKRYFLQQESTYKDFPEKQVNQMQWALTRRLLRWLEKRCQKSNSPEQPDEEVLREFEDLLEASWSSDWPAFARLSPSNLPMESD